MARGRKSGCPTNIRETSFRTHSSKISQRNFPNAMPLTDHGDILLYNDILRKVAAEEDAAVNDLYAVVSPAKGEMIGEDHIHLTPAGIEACAAQTAEVIRKALG